jgi:uncharacterized protein YbjT (DUF2867 family)
MNNEQFLILGGNGKTGRRVVERLQNLGKTVRIGSRSASPAFDWQQPETWPAALEGITAAYITYQPDLAVPGALEAVEHFTKVAMEAGVQKFVLLSGKGEEEAQKCEQVVMQSGANWTIVRASWFNQNFSESFFLAPIQEGVVALPKADAKVPYVDANDIADVVTAALLKAEHNGQMYELTGPRQLTFPEAVAEIAAASKRAIQFVPITMAQYEEGLRKANLPEDYVWLVTYLFNEVLTEDNSIVTNDIEKVLGRPATDFKTYAEKVAQTDIWKVSATVD